MLTRCGAVALEGVADGAVVDLRVAGGHPRAGVAEQLLDDVLGHAGVDEPGPDGVTELVRVDAHGLAGLVANVDLLLPLAELARQCSRARRALVPSGFCWMPGNSQGEPSGQPVRTWCLLGADGGGGLAR